jgi:hypothetical protein
VERHPSIPRWDLGNFNAVRSVLRRVVFHRVVFLESRILDAGAISYVPMALSIKDLLEACVVLAMGLTFVIAFRWKK